jgi:hypothetical protein
LKIVSVRLSRLGCFALTGFALGCGVPSVPDAGAEPDASVEVDSGSGDADAGAADSGLLDSGLLDAGLADAGQDAGFIIAPHQVPPQVTKNTGPVIAAPKLLIATFPNEPLAADLETFAQGIGATAYWAATTFEYGVGPATFSRSVHVAAAAPATITDVQVQAWLTAQLDGTHPEWGPVDPTTLYTIVYPAGTVVTRDGSSTCQATPAYHLETQVAGGIRVAYAVIARCDPIFGLSGIDYLTAGLSHEWIETATDPFYFNDPAYDGPLAKYTGWTLVNGGELADMCTMAATAYLKPTGFPFTVQRSWSNAAAMAGHDPCVPAVGAPYVGAAPLMPDTVVGKFFGYALSMEGVKVPLNQPTVIEVDLFSDGPSSTPWTVTAVDYGYTTGTSGVLSFAWNKQSGVNGDKLQLTITRLKNSSQLTGIALFGIVSTLGTQQNIWVGAAGD